MTETSGWDDISRAGRDDPVAGASPCRTSCGVTLVSGRLPIGIIFTGFSTVWISLAVWMATSIRGAFADASAVPDLRALPFPRYRSLHAGGPRGPGMRLCGGDVVTRCRTVTPFVATEILGQRKLDIHPIAHMTEAGPATMVCRATVNLRQRHPYPPAPPAPGPRTDPATGWRASTTVKTGFFPHR